MNRRDLQEALESTWARCTSSDCRFGIILFNIDRFKLVNGRFGHHLADKLLERVNLLAQEIIPDTGKLGRWAGDEFLCLLPDTDLTACTEFAEKLRETIANSAFPVDSSVINLTASFGVAVYPDDGNHVRALLLTADEALCQAKRSGRNRIVTTSNLKHHTLRIGNVLDTALREERVMPAYQPIVDLQSGTVVAEEALARIITTDGQVIAAEEFMSVASHFQLTHKIDRTVLLSAFSRYLAYHAARKPIMHFVNISGDLLRHPELFKELLNSVRSLHAVSDSLAIKEFPLVIEITERELLGSPDSTRRMLAPFLELGVRLALDDFGSGYSSFHYLADLPVSFLKIDGRFTQDIHEPKVRAIVRGIQNTATDLGLITLAEYVETEKQADTLRELGIDWAQGHYYGQAILNEQEADTRRQMSANWSQGYYYHKPVH